MNVNNNNNNNMSNNTMSTNNPMNVNNNNGMKVDRINKKISESSICQSKLEYTKLTLQNNNELFKVSQTKNCSGAPSTNSSYNNTRSQNQASTIDFVFGSITDYNQI